MLGDITQQLLERSHWDDDPDFPVEDWQYEVANGDTRRGYAQWVETQKESQEQPK